MRKPFPQSTKAYVPSSNAVFAKGQMPDYLPPGMTMEDYMVYDYENEEAPTDEARTNEEALEEDQLAYSKYPPDLKLLNRLAQARQGGNCVFFNEEGLEDGEEDDEDSSDQDDAEEEEGEFDPALVGGQFVGDDEDDY